MARMIEERNALVELGDNPHAPEVRDAGVEIAFAAAGQAQFPVGEPVVLHGGYQADSELLAICDSMPSTGVLLTLLPTARVFGATERLVTPTTTSAPPAPAGPPSDTYREAGQFRVDLAKFFDLPDEPATYTVQASLGPYCSDRLGFAVIPR